MVILSMVLPLNFLVGEAALPCEFLVRRFGSCLLAIQANSNKSCDTLIEKDYGYNSKYNSTSNSTDIELVQSCSFSKLKCLACR